MSSGCILKVLYDMEVFSINLYIIFLISVAKFEAQIDFFIFMESYLFLFLSLRFWYHNYVDFG